MAHGSESRDGRGGTDARGGTGKELLVRCTNCDHVWPIIVLPATVQDIERAMRDVRCPACCWRKCAVVELPQ